MENMALCSTLPCRIRLSVLGNLTYICILHTKHSLFICLGHLQLSAILLRTFTKEIMAIYNQLLGIIMLKITVITRATEETHKNSKTVRGDICK